MQKINLLVTGGCGFIGSNFINYIYNKNKYCIINIDAMYHAAKEEHILSEIRESKDYTLIKGNIKDIKLLEDTLEKYKIQQVIHFAAQSHVEESFYNSLQYTHDNVLGTHTLLEAMRKYKKIQKFVHISTDEVYGESKLNSKKKETSYLLPTNPYAATKAAAEFLVLSEYFSFKLPIIITRSNNVYGPNQCIEKLIPRFITLLKNNKKVTIQGKGTALRCFIYVDDIVKALEIILEKGKFGEIYNISDIKPIEYSVMDIAKMLIKIIHNTENYAEWIEYIQDRPFNDERYYIAGDKIKKLGWSSTNKDFQLNLKKLIQFHY